MITVSKKYKIVKGKAPYTQDWNTTNDCVTVVEGPIIDDIINVTFQFENADCLEFNNEVELYLVDSENCSNKYKFTIADPCTDFDFLFDPAIQKVKNLTFKAPVPSKDGPFIWKWSFDENIFRIKDQYDDTVELEIVGGNIKNNDSFPITVYVENKFGCCIEATRDYEFCGPQANKVEVTINCEDLKSRIFGLPVSLCGKVDDSECNVLFYVPLNNNRNRFVTPTGIEVIDFKDGKVQIEVEDNLTPGTYTIFYTVVDMNGLESTNEICVEIPYCDKGNLFGIYTSEFVYGCTDCEPGDTRVNLKGLSGPFNLGECNEGTVSVSLQDAVSLPDVVNWESFTFIPGTGQVLVSRKELVSDAGTAIFTDNRDIEFTPLSPGFKKEILTVSLENKNKTHKASGDFIFRSNLNCKGVPHTEDDNYWVKEDSILQFNPTINDSGEWSTLEFLGPLPGLGKGVISVNNITGAMTYNASGNNLPDQYIFTYRLKGPGGEASPPATVTININKLDAKAPDKIELCRINADNVDVYGYLDSMDKTGSWTYLGVDRTERSKLRVNNQDVRFYEVNEDFLPKSYKLNIDFTEAKEGIHYFEYSKGLGGFKISYEVAIEIIDAIEMPEDITVLSCITDPEFDIRVMSPDLPEGGTWFNTIPGTGPVTNFIFNPEESGVGLHEYTYTINNRGCSSVFTLTIIVSAEVYAGEDTCTKLCSVGPDPEEEEYCRNQKNFLPDNSTPPCVVCLFSNLYGNPDKSINQNGKWYLELAPLNTVFLNINGGIYKIKVGDEIPGGFNPCIDFNKAVLGDYRFKYVVDLGCKDEAFLDFAIFPAPCELPAEVDLSICTQIDKTLYQLLTDALAQLGITNCLANETGNWYMLSGPSTHGIYLTEDDDGTNDYMSTEAFSGDYKFLYQYRQDNIDSTICGETQCFSSCDTCKRDIILNVDYGSGPPLGLESKWAVCNAVGGCEFPLKQTAPGAPNTNLSWYYEGFNSASPNQPNPAELGNIPDIVTNKGSMYNPGDQVLAIHTTNPNDTDSLPIINFEGATTGYYFFRVEQCDDGCCSELEVAVQVVEGPNAGDDGECLTLCTSKPECIELHCILGGTPGTQGQWRLISAFDCDNLPVTVPTASGPCTGNGLFGACNPCSQFGPLGDSGFYPGMGTTGRFNTTGMPCGTYVFGYRSSVPPLGPDYFLYNCGACEPREAFVTIMITTAENPGPGGTGNTCS